MDKYEYRLKLAQIEKLIEKKDYVTAAKIADSIDWRKVRSVTTLNMIADIYEETDRLEDCYELLNMVYDRSPVGRAVVYHLAEVAVKMHNFEDAIELYKEFVRIAPHDLSKYILKYQIYKERGSSVEDQIAILEEFKGHEYDDRWAYELASLYAEAGRIEQCVEECDELILWFSEGEYVVKAMELKMKYQDLTASQQEKYEHRFEMMEPEEVEEEIEESSEEDSVPEEDDTPKVAEVNVHKFSTMNLQEELAKELQSVLEEDEAEKAEESEGDTASEEEILTEETNTEIAEEAEPEEEEQKGDTKEYIPLENTGWTVKKEGPAEEVPVKEVKTEPALQEQATAEKPKMSETAELQTEILKYATVEQEPKLEELLCTEEDGQMSIAIHQGGELEKQITGQMSIEEILEAWEEKKRQMKEDAEGSAEGKKTEVLYETGEITELLHDFVPTTPKDEEETEPEGLEAEIEEEPQKEEVPETEIEEEPQKEEVLETEIEEEELQKEDFFDVQIAEPDWDEVPEELPAEEPELEDDLPLEIDREEEEPQEKVGQSTASMLDAIERALALEVTPTETDGHYMTEEQEAFFKYFTSVKGMKKQLLKLLKEDHAYEGREDSKEGNLIITGHPGNGKTTLAIDIVKAFQKQRQEKGGKLGKVSGEGLNKKDPADVLAKLGGGALIIERAGSINGETAEKLSDAMEENTGGVLVILEDSAEEINRLLGNHEALAEKFNRSIDIPIFSNDELVAFGKSYAEEQEYYFDEMAVLALYDCIGVRQTSEHVVNITEVKEFVDDAIAHAEKKSKNIFVRLSKKRIDEYGNKLLLEEDFDY